MHPEAEAIHGISTAFLQDKPLFDEVVDDFLAFIGDATLSSTTPTSTSASSTWSWSGSKPAAIGMDRVVDTLALARRKHPAGPNTLDALCKRYGIDNSKRTKHGAIIDSLLLAGVYVELLGERQATLGLAADADAQLPATQRRRRGARCHGPAPLPPRLTGGRRGAHRNSSRAWARTRSGAATCSLSGVLACRWPSSRRTVCRSAGPALLLAPHVERRRSRSDRASAAGSRPRA